MAEDYPWPDEHGRFGPYGGRFVPEILIPALTQLEQAYREAMADPAFKRSYAQLLREVVGRPSLLTEARRLSDAWGARILLKREDLNHSGAHKINNTMGQGLLCQRMGKRRIIAETGAGQHGVATATVCALMGFECVVYMGAEDVARQALNVDRMRLMGAEVVPVQSGTRTLKDAMNEAMRDWVTNVDSTHYMVGSAAGPHPYPVMVRDLQRVIGDEAKAQCSEALGGAPDHVVACVGGGSNAMGLFFPFLEEARSGTTTIWGAEAAGHGVASGEHSAPLVAGSVGVLHGSRTKIMQDEAGQILGAHSVAAGLDYPGVGPEHAYWQAQGLATYEAVDDHEAIAALKELARREGIICALETAHGLALAKRVAERHPGSSIVLGLSGRGDKDMHTLAEFMNAHPETA